MYLWDVQTQNLIQQPAFEHKISEQNSDYNEENRRIEFLYFVDERHSELAVDIEPLDIEYRSLTERRCMSVFDANR